MLRKMDVTMSGSKIKLLKAMASTKLNSFDKKEMLKSWSRLNNFDQGGAKGGTIAVPNLQDRSLDKKC